MRHSPHIHTHLCDRRISGRPPTRLGRNSRHHHCSFWRQLHHKVDSDTSRPDTHVDNIHGRCVECTSQLSDAGHSHLNIHGIPRGNTIHRSWVAIFIVAFILLPPSTLSRHTDRARLSFVPQSLDAASTFSCGRIWLTSFKSKPGHCESQHLLPEVGNLWPCKTPESACFALDANTHSKTSVYYTNLFACMPNLIKYSPYTDRIINGFPCLAYVGEPPPLRCGPIPHPTDITDVLYYSHHRNLSDVSHPVEVPSWFHPFYSDCEPQWRMPVDCEAHVFFQHKKMSLTPYELAATYRLRGNIVITPTVPQIEQSYAAIPAKEYPFYQEITRPLLFDKPSSCIPAASWTTPPYRAIAECLAHQVSENCSPITFTNRPYDCHYNISLINGLVHRIENDDAYLTACQRYTPPIKGRERGPPNWLMRWIYDVIAHSTTTFQSIIHVTTNVLLDLISYLDRVFDLYLILFEIAFWSWCTGSFFWGFIAFTLRPLLVDNFT